MAKGRILAGLYTDGCWYRVKNEGISGTQMRVLFVDYGNHDVLELANVRELPPAAEQLQPLARPAVLAGLKAPTKASEHFENASICFHNSAFDRVLQAKVECVDKSNRAHLTLTDPAHPELSINSLLLRDGWCRLAEKPEWKLKTSVMPALAKDEEFAKQHRLNIWEYGDVSDEEEDENPRLFDGRTGKPLTR